MMFIYVLDQPIAKVPKSIVADPPRGGVLKVKPPGV